MARQMGMTFRLNRRLWSSLQRVLVQVLGAVAEGAHLGAVSGLAAAEATFGGAAAGATLGAAATGGVAAAVMGDAYLANKFNTRTARNPISRPNACP